MTQSPVIMEENVLVPHPSHVNVLQAGLVPIVELVSVELNLLHSFQWHSFQHHFPVSKYRIFISKV